MKKTSFNDIPNGSKSKNRVCESKDLIHISLLDTISEEESEKKKGDKREEEVRKEEKRE